MSGGLGVDVLTMGVFIGAVMLFGAVALLGTRSSARARLDERIQRVGGKKFVVTAQALANVRRKDLQDGPGGLRGLIHRIVPRRRALIARLERTGRNIPLWSYALVCVAIAVVVTLAGGAFGGMPWALALLAGIVAGLAVPHYMVGRMARKRINKFITLFPDALDLLVRTVKSGLPIAEGIAVASQDFPEPIGTEFRRIADSMKVGATLEEALWKTAERIAVPEFNFFVVSLSVQRETGGNIAETLANLSKLLRRRQQMKLKIRALSSEARASAWILSMLPFGMFGILLMVNSPYVMTLFTDVRGMVLIGVALVSQLIGIAVMVKMARFEI